MSSQVQFRRGTASQTLVFTGALGEITVNTTSNTLVVHDGMTPGGWPVVGTLATQTLTNKTLSAATLTGTTTITGDLIPSANVTYNLGSDSQRFKDLYLDGSTIYLGGATISTVGGNVTITNQSGETLTVGDNGSSNFGNIGFTGNIVGGTPSSVNQLSGNLFVGLGTPRPVGTLVVSNAIASHSGPDNTDQVIALFSNRDSANTKVLVCSTGTYDGTHAAVPTVQGRYSRGTADNPTVLQPQDVLASFSGLGFSNTTTGSTQGWPSVSNASINLIHDGNSYWTPSSTPTGIVMFATPVGSNVSQAVVHLYGNGRMSMLQTVSTTALGTGSIVTPGGISANGNVYVGQSIVATGNITSYGANINALSSNVQVNSIYVGDIYASSNAGATTGGGSISATGSLNVTGQAGFASTVNISANTAAAIYTNTGALTVAGGVGIAGNIVAGVSTPVGKTVHMFYGNTVLGEASPVLSDAILTVTRNGSTSINGDNFEGTLVHLAGADSGNARIIADSYGSSVYSAYTGRRARGSAGTPSAVQTNDVLFRIAARGYGTTGFPAFGTGRISLYSDGVFTDSSMPSSIGFDVTQAGSAIAVEAMRLSSTGNLVIKTTTPSTSTTTGALVVAGGVGIQGDLYVAGNIVAAGNTVIENTYINNISVNTTDQLVVGSTIPSTTPTTGALVVTGGVGINGDVHLGSTLTVASSTVISGSLNAGALVATSINNTPIGASTASTGKFTTLTSTSTTTLGAVSATSIDSTPIGASSTSTGAFTTLSASAGITGTLQTAAQPNITSVGALTSLSVTGLSAVGSATVASTLNVGGASVLGGNVLITSTEDMNGTNASTGSLQTAGGLSVAGSTYVGDTLYIGPQALAQSGSFANPALVATNNGPAYAQMALKNVNSSGSADFAAYGELGTDASGWVDMGFAGSSFSDPNYTITKPQDGYLITRPTSNSFGGNLVLATSEGGAFNDIVIGVGSFFANSEVARFHGNTSTSGYFQVTTGTSATSTTTGALRVTGGAGVSGALYAGSLFDNGNRVLTNLTSSGSGNLTVSVSAPAGTTISLPATGPGATTVGSSSSIPVITTDAYGRVTALTTASITTTLGIAGSSGTGTVALASQSLTVAASSGISTSASGQTITVTNTGVLSLASSGAGNVTVSASTGAITLALPATGPGATTVGSSSSIPVITTDAYGRVTALTSASITTTLNTAADTGTSSVSLASQTLTIAGGTGISTNDSSQVITITNTGVLSLNSSGSGNISVSNSTGTVTLGLPTTGPGLQTWGGVNGAYPIIPTFTTDAYGRVTAASNISLSITSNISGTSGSTGAITNGQTFAFATTNGMVLTASGNTITISTPQNITTSGTPTFAGLTTNGATQVNGTLGVTGITSITNNTVSTGAGNGALVVTGGVGVSGTSYYAGDLHVIGNIYTPNLVATSTTTLNVSSPMVYLTASPYPYNFETGFYSHFIGGPANVYAHTGFVRNHNNNLWTLFSNVASEPSGSNINFADAGLIYDSLQLGGIIVSNATSSTSTTTGAITVAGGVGISGNLNVNSAGYFGYNAFNTPLTNPTLVSTSSSNALNAGQFYVQNALINTASSGSADYIAYGNNYPGATVSDHGWMDMGFTGNTFSDPNFGITKSNDGYLFASAVAGSGLGGNLVLATDNTGTYGDIVFATGSFAANAEVARFHGNASTSGYLQITTGTAASSTTTGALRVTGGMGVSGSIYTGGIYTNSINFANGSPFVSTTLANTTEITANISSGSNAGLSLAPTGVTAGNYGSATSIPTIVVDSKGRITSITSNVVSTTISLAGTSGTGSVAGGGTLTVNGANGVTTSATGSTITVSLGSISVSGVTSTGNIVAGSGTASTSNVTGAMVVTGGAGITGDLYVQGNVYQKGVRVFKNTTSTTAPTNPVAGDEWYNSSTDVFYKYLFDGTSFNWIDLISASQPAPTLGTVTANSISVIGGLTAATVTDNGNRVVTSVTPTAGTGISVSGVTSTGPSASFTINNTGVTSLVAGTDITISGSTGAVTVNDASTLATVTARGATTSTALTLNNTLNMGGHVVPTANVTYNLGSSTAWWNNFYGTAVHAAYADLAENYLADQPYGPGTVVMFGGEYEVTAADAGTTAVAGIISTNPAYLMNGQLTAGDGQYVVALALQGRVPCRVFGPVSKGDLMIAGPCGMAQSASQIITDISNISGPAVGSVIGKALQNFDGNGEGLIEVVVGRV